MTDEHKRVTRPLRDRGGNVCAVIPKAICKRLAWNINDVVTYDVIDGHLVLTKVKLPTMPDLRLSRAGDSKAT